MNRVERIKEKLVQAFNPSYLKVDDMSADHEGHAGAAGGAGHYAIEISASVLTPKNRIEQHRMIYAALDDLMHHEIHALVIKVKG